MKEQTQFMRTELLLGEEAIKRLASARVAVFGIGGVGGYVAEALARSGVGALDLVDHDTISVTNLNRQIIALHSTVGEYKAEVMKKRILDINPDAVVTVHTCFYLPETRDQFDLSAYSYVVDAVDTVTAKLLLAEETRSAGVSLISSMGTGNKMNPALLRVSDIYETSVDPLSRVMRRELRKRGIDHLKVVWSTEEPRKPLLDSQEIRRLETGAPKEEDGMPSRRLKDIPGSTAFVPAAAGLLIASEVVRDLIG